MLVPEKRPLFRKPRFQDNPYRVVLWIFIAIGFLFILRGISNKTIQPLFLSTPTPTRTINSYSMEGETQFAAGNLPAAIEAYKKAVEVDPTNATIWAELARIQTYSTTLLTTDMERYQRLKEALASIEQDVQLTPDESFVHAIRAFVLDWTANPSYVGAEWQSILTRAEQEAIKAIQLDNTNTLALAYYAEILADQQNLIQADGYIKQAVDRSPNLMDVRRINAYVEESMSNYSAAIEEYQKAIALAPNLTFLYQYVGANYRTLASKEESSAMASELYDKALEYFDKAVRINEQQGILDPIPYLSIAKTYSQMGEYFSAALNVRKALQYNPYSPDIYGQLGIVYFKSRNYEGSIPALKCAVEGCTAEESCEVRRCNPDTDPQVPIEGLPLSPNTIVYYYTYGSVLSAMHTDTTDYCGKAMIILEKVRAAFPTDPIVVPIVEEGEAICLRYGYSRPNLP
jgi:tetratricopeptide (TPR) repeat protein